MGSVPVGNGGLSPRAQNWENRQVCTILGAKVMRVSASMGQLFYLRVRGLWKPTVYAIRGAKRRKC